MRIECSSATGLITSVLPSNRPRLFLDGAEYPLPAGGVILPGFTDSHAHLIGLGEMGSKVNLVDARSAQECAQRIAQHAKTVPSGTWIQGFGWNQERWDSPTLPTRELLDRLIPDHPVILLRIDTHAAWVNSAAIHAAAITPRWVDGGEVLLDGTGQPNGILIDNAMGLAFQQIPPITTQQKMEWIAYGVQQCLRYGITSLHDMNVEPERLEAMVRLAEHDEMSIRCEVFLKAQGEEWRAVPQPQSLAKNLSIVGVKYFADGALGSRGALLLEPYSDDPTTHGIQLLSADQLAGLANEPARRGFAVATHAIGDGANRLVLDAYQQLRNRYPDALLRVEHAQIVHPDDVPRFAQLGVLPSMQPTHCTSDATMAEQRLGYQRCGYAYGWQNLRRTGVPILAGSDFPIESPDPIAGIRAFVERLNSSTGKPWYPEQRIAQQEAIAAFTEWPAAGIPGQPRRGRIAEGYAADIVVLSGNPYGASQPKTIATIVAGNVAWQWA